MWNNFHSNGKLLFKWLRMDFLFWEAADLSYENIKARVKLLQEVGFAFHRKKSVLVATQKNNFFGFVIKSVTKKVRLTEERKDAIYSFVFNLPTTYMCLLES